MEQQPDFATIEAAARTAAESEFSPIKPPTEKQKAAGNYKTGRVTIHGFNIAIENPRGSYRHGTDANGKKWSSRINDHYGYIVSIGNTKFNQMFPQSAIADANDAGYFLKSESITSKVNNGFDVISVLVPHVITNNSSLFKNLSKRAFGNIESFGYLGSANAFIDEINGIINIPSERVNSLNIDTLLDQARSYYRSAYAYIFGDSVHGESILSHGYDSLDINIKSFVKSNVITGIENDKIFNGIVGFLLVDMMDMFFSSKLSSESRRNYKTMLLDRLTRSFEFDNPVFIGGFIDLIATRLPVTLATWVAEEILTSFVAPTISNKGGVAIGASHSVSGHGVEKYSKRKKGIIGADGDPVDCFIGTFMAADRAYVINQFVNGRFDETKIMMCFADEAQAKLSYQLSFDRGWDGLSSIVEVTYEQLKWWLKNGDMSRPLIEKNLPFKDLESVTMKPVWQEDTLTNSTIDRLLYDLRRTSDGLMFDSVNLQDIYDDADGRLAFDALVVPYQTLERKMKVVERMLNHSGQNISVAATQISEPFKQYGVTNVAVVFELSDGQTVSIFFHNPDVDPRKLNQSDELISWKWLLNKKDITVVVAPEMGKDLNIQTVAKRVMALANKNSAAFAKTNTNRAQRLERIQGLRDEIATLETELTQVQHELEVAKVEVESRANIDWSKARSIESDAELQALGVARIDEIGSENVYIEKDGKPYYVKPGNTDRFAVGMHDFSNDFVFYDGEQAGMDGYKTIEYSDKDGKPVKAYSKFLAGDRVKQTLGLRWSGEVVQPFGVPDHNGIIQEVVVKWDNGVEKLEYSRELELIDTATPETATITGTDPAPTETTSEDADVMKELEKLGWINAALNKAIKKVDGFDYGNNEVVTVTFMATEEDNQWVVNDDSSAFEAVVRATDLNGGDPATMAKAIDAEVMMAMADRDKSGSSYVEIPQEFVAMFEAGHDENGKAISQDYNEDYSPLIVSAYMIERYLNTKPVTLKWGNYNHSASASIFDDAMGGGLVGSGIIGQIGTKQGVIGRIDIDEKGMVTILKGGSGLEALNTATDQFPEVKKALDVLVGDLKFVMPHEQTTEPTINNEQTSTTETTTPEETAGTEIENWHVEVRKSLGLMGWDGFESGDAMTATKNGVKFKIVTPDEATDSSLFDMFYDDGNTWVNVDTVSYKEGVSAYSVATNLDKNAVFYSENMEKTEDRYQFGNATEEFKDWAYSNAAVLATAKRMDDAAAANGAHIEWGFFNGFALDSAALDGAFDLKGIRIPEKAIERIVNDGDFDIEMHSSLKGEIKSTKTKQSVGMLTKSGSMASIIILHTEKPNPLRAWLATNDFLTEDEAVEALSVDEKFVFDDASSNPKYQVQCVKLAKAYNDSLKGRSTKEAYAKIKESLDMVDAESVKRIEKTVDKSGLNVPPSAFYAMDSVALDARRDPVTEIVVYEDGKRIGAMSWEQFKVKLKVPSHMFMPEALEQQNAYLKSQGSNIVYKSEWTKEAKKRAKPIGMDSIVDDENTDPYVGKIIKKGFLLGRVDIAVDGKAMVYVGASGDQRVQYNGRDAYYSDDDAGLLVDWLFNEIGNAVPNDELVKVDPEPAPTDPEPAPETNTPKINMALVSKDIKRSVQVIIGIDDKAEGFAGYDRSLFVSSITGKIKTMHKNGKQDQVNANLEFIAEAQKDRKKPVITKTNSVWALYSASEEPAPTGEVTGEVTGETLPLDYRGYRIYKSTVGGKEYVAVDVGRGGPGDTLHATIEEAKKEIDFMMRQEEDRIKREENARIEQEKEAQEAAKRNDLDGFESTLTPMQRGKAVEALNKMFNTSNGVLSLKSFIKKRIEDGFKPEIIEEKRIKDPTRTAWNRMDDRQQRDFEKRQKEGGMVPKYYLTNDDGVMSEINKTGYDYAQYLLSQKTVEEHAPVEETKTYSMSDALAPIKYLKNFIGGSQLSAIGSGIRSEEKQFFIKKVIDLEQQIKAMPKTYDTDGQGNRAIAYLHYFKGGSDWYITERDMEDEQLQAFGYAILNGDTQMAEMGYISIEELISNNVELDLYWDPKSIANIKGVEEDAPNQDDEEETAVNEETTPDPVIEPEPEAPAADPIRTEIDAEIESLRSETDIITFDRRLDDLAAKVEAAGLMEEYEPKLNDVADVLTFLLAEAEKAA